MSSDLVADDGEVVTAEAETTTNKKVETDLKMYLLVRTDIGMRPGKACAQCAHAAIGAYKTAFAHGHAEMLRRWERHGATKITLRVSSEKQLWDIYNAVSTKTTTHVVVDEGLTQVAPDSVTVLAIGPVNPAVVAEHMRPLKLYN